MVIEVTEVNPDDFDGSSVVRGTGTVVSNGSDDSHLIGKHVQFFGDWRPMLDLFEAVEAEGTVLAEVDEWAVTIVE